MARVTVRNEHRHERESDVVADVYPDRIHAVVADVSPDGIHAVVADALREGGHEVRTATLDEGPDHGLTEAVLDDTDVLVW